MQRYLTFKTSILSRLFGCFASTAFPPFFQTLINKTYTKLMNVDLNDFHALESYPTLNALFTRKLLKERVFDISETTFISPCDSFISASGNIAHDRALQIKGHAYTVSTLLSDYCSYAHKKRVESGVFINFYLSPKDYHRYHVPIDMRIAKAVHIPGKLYPVNMTWLRKVNGLFCENERVVLECYTKENALFYMIFVGALNVGKMRFSFDDAIQTNAKASLQQCYMYENLFVKKGEELGRFEMGSTIVMLFEKESFSLLAHDNEPIRFGATLGELRQEC
ncbi:MAG: phosphatidylserine decarboxylase [Sulfurovum sp. FS06-10]|nr:MAG: phosphatidylserine decarboxylase [Sulfurovum sp. FS06-10]